MEIFSTKGYFVWLTKGYSYTLENMDSLLTAHSLEVSKVKRNEAHIARAGKDYGANFVNAYFNETLEKLSPKYVADLGCGSADRLISILKKDSSIKGIGIDISPHAIEVAKENIKTAKLEDRLDVICADINSLNPSSSFKDVELVFSFFMGHDLWPKDNCLKVLNHIKKVFFKATNFLLCDTYKSDKSLEIPIFILGFELTHAFMGQRIPTYADWLGLFEDLNWTVVEAVNVDVPYSTIFNLRMR